MGHKLVHLGHLFCDVNVNRPVQCRRRRKAGGRNGAQRMGRLAQHGIAGQGGQMPRGPLAQAQIAVQIIAKAQLPARQFPPITAAAFIQHRQQRQPKASFLCRRTNLLRHLGAVGIGHTADRVVQIVKLCHGPVTRLCHFHHDLGGDDAHIFGRKVFQKAVHQAAPCPKAVLASGAVFGQPRHGALKSVAVQVDRRGQQAAHAHPAACWTNRRDPAIGDVNRDILHPALRQQGMVGVQQHGRSLTLEYVQT